MEPVWAPRVLDKLTSADLQLYLDFSSSACIKGGACSVDTALQVLYQSEGDIKLAVQRLIHGLNSSNPVQPAPPPTPTATPPPPLPPLPTPPTTTPNNSQLSLLSTTTTSTDSSHCLPCLDPPTTTTKTDTFWTKDELHLFERLFGAYGKNFSAISRELRSKSTKECIEHYYLWKKSSTRTNNTNTSTPPRRVVKYERDSNNNTTHHHHHHHQNHHHLNHINEYPNNNHIIVKQELTSPLDSIHSGTTASPSLVTSTTATSPEAGAIAMKLVINSQDQLPPGQQLPPSEQFPCKVCGRVFLKIKSRSAHMKRHKNER